MILGDLEFESGSANLGPGPFLSLTKLADYLNTTPDARIVLVGHTDAVGSLAGNMDLSAKRARRVNIFNPEFGRRSHATGCTRHRIFIAGRNKRNTLREGGKPKGGRCFDSAIQVMAIKEF